MSFADLNIGDAAEAGPDAGPAVTETTVVIVGAGPAGYETPQRHLSLPIDVPVRLLPRFLTLSFSLLFTILLAKIQARGRRIAEAKWGGLHRIGAWQGEQPRITRINTFLNLPFSYSPFPSRRHLHLVQELLECLHAPLALRVSIS